MNPSQYQYRLSGTPREDGFHMPAEWYPHEGTWMIWPERTDNWRLGAKPAQRAFAHLARTIARFEPVTLGVSARQYEHASVEFTNDPAIRVIELSSNDAWVRDTGPTIVVNAQGERRGVDWQFNAWGGLNGGLYFPWDLDDHVASKLLATERLARYRADFVLEGGSIHVDGEGTLLATEACLLSPNRNPTLSRSDLETRLRDHLGIEKVLWVPQGIYMDETDDHVDNMACFVQPGVVVLAWTDDQNDPQYARSAAALAYLQQQTDAQGRPITVHKLPLPSPLFMTEEEAQGVDHNAHAEAREGGNRLAASYVNFYLCNGGLIMPAFDDPNDAIAAEILAGLFPEHKVVQIPGREILLGGGNIHCITQQLPV